jgi:hypothetical protein
LETE